ncbi:bile acid:sodium symporter [Niveispirillum lacus]|uniref:Bile acid:sodium symporter n=1 Tax=Niveispirillum lacus TaxID=1981099 RepID=A0A255YX11_9PROT|nr:bile acid:sodium symporter family protein [Niveispirillum lacus]OYQ33728.1 bile acid:sodium symporter [Niveispirillum lacus]
MNRILVAIVDPFLLALLATVGLAALFPATGPATVLVNHVADAAIALLFFFHGAKLSRDAILAGIGHWRLHLAVLASTFGLFPLLGLAAGLLPASVLSPVVATGILYLCLLPSTVQSSIAFVSIAGGNVPAAICSASASNLLGIFITPLMVGLLMHTGGQAGISLAALEAIILQLLVPFIAGHLARPLIGQFVQKHKQTISYTDRGSILLVVYSAFSAAMVEGLWHKVAPSDLLVISAASIMLLAMVLVATALTGRWLGFTVADRIVLVFCGSKKSLVSGVPMAGVLFPVAQVGLIILPLMIFHQIQLLVCTWLAARYRRSA